MEQIIIETLGSTGYQKKKKKLGSTIIFFKKNIWILTNFLGFCNSEMVVNFSGSFTTGTERIDLFLSLFFFYATFYLHACTAYKKNLKCTGFDVV